jgi:oryzin
MVGIKQLALLAAALLPAASAFPKPPQPPPRPRADPDVIPGRYIVTLQKGLDTDTVSQHIHSATALHTRSNSGFWGITKQWHLQRWNGYAAHFDDDTIEQIRGDTNVLAVEPDRVRHLMALETQKDAPWGLSSMSHKAANTSGSDYVYDSVAGEGTFAYIIDTGMIWRQLLHNSVETNMDTGVLDTHEEFEGSRAIKGYNAVPDVPFEDVDGHGTHVAGTICGKTYGVAKKASCVSIKVFNGGSASTETILNAYEWAVNDITEQGREATAVISMSLGGSFSEAENNALEAAYDSGILTVVAAGNDGEDASDYSPASSPNAITVGAYDSSNTRADFSNYGEVVDIFGPGVAIESAWIGGDDATESLDGTSMATPHIAGLALYLKSLYPEELATPDATTTKLKELAIEGIKDPKGASIRGYNGSGK